MPSLNIFNSLLIKKSAKSRSTKKTLKSNQQTQQTIKLHIELPYYPCSQQYDQTTHDDQGDIEYEAKIQHNANNDGKQLISLHISIDSRMLTPRKATKMAANRRTNTDTISTIDTMTSGYSSGSDSQNEHIYDTLKYLSTPSMTSAKRRHSIASSSSSSSLSSSASTSTVNIVSPSKSQINSPNDNHNDYEEISNFSQITATSSLLSGHANTDNNCPSYLYQTLYNCKSSSIKRIRTLNCARVTTSTLNDHTTPSSKHDYTVNDLFRHLEEFKKDANEQESLICKRMRLQTHSYVNDKISKL
jgi:hypothetical protein